MEIITCIIIILILIVIHTLWAKYIYDPGYDMFALDILDIENPPDLHTGDIIFMKNCPQCKCTDDILDNGWQMTYKKVFNTFRQYITEVNYTHVAIVLKLNGKPYICHIDGGDPMFDEITNTRLSGSVTVSGMNHINARGGPITLFRYTGTPIEKNMMTWIDRHRSIKYPTGLRLLVANGMQWGKNSTGVMACTDFVESTLIHLELMKKKPSQQCSLSDIYKFILDSGSYSSAIIIKNKCYYERHFA